jgi:hypothetical protein
MNRKTSNGWRNPYALLALVAWVPLGLGAKGCDHAIVGDDGHDGGCTTDCPSGEAGADTGGTTSGGDAGKGGNAGTSGHVGKGGDAGRGGTSATGGAPATGGASTTGGSPSTGGSMATGGAPTNGGAPTGGSAGGGQAGSAGNSVCGGLQGLTCDTGQYCDFALAAQCGAADQTGTCRPILTGGCTADYNPVCGCDGTTYSNGCEAAHAGVAVAATGACAASGATCGGVTGALCDGNSFCKFPSTVGQSCGSGDQTGTCEKIPDLCDAVFTPVCGCDGKTYSSECYANTQGVSITSADACPSSSTTCGGITGMQCPDGQYCDFPTATNCGSGDQTGTCRDKNVVCPQVTGTALEVCGCDGKTYFNSCAAQQAGVAIASSGACTK